MPAASDSNGRDTALPCPYWMRGVEEPKQKVFDSYIITRIKKKVEFLYLTLNNLF
jgi:hypothetical protein